MGWARMDDGYMDHPKILEVGLMAEILDRRAIEHCAKYETDGLVTKSALKRISRDVTRVSSRVLALVEVGRWTVNEGGGWWIHDYLKYNPSKAQKEAQREAGRERVRNHRSNAVTRDVTNAYHSKGRGGESFSEPKTAEIVDLPTSEPPWIAQGITRAEWVEAGRREGGTLHDGGQTRERIDANAHFIADAPTDVAALVAEVRSLRASQFQNATKANDE